jgi:hypothetical protein
VAAPISSKAVTAFVIAGLCLIAVGVAGVLIRRAVR